MNESSADKRLQILSLATIILGVLAVGTPHVAGESMLMLIGILIALAGVIRLVWAIKSPTPGRGIPKVLLGVLTIVAGSVILANCLLVNGVLSNLLATYLVF